MTIQQHASFDSSAAELNATSKLVKAWESKNAKNAAKAGGISMMALSLAACGGSDSTTTAVVADPVTPVTPVTPTGATFDLTPLADVASTTTAVNGSIASSFRFSSGNDTVNAISASMQTTDTLLDASTTDTDVINITATAAMNALTAVNIEGAVVNMASGTPTAVFTNFTGLNTVSVSGVVAGTVTDANSAEVTLDGYTRVLTLNDSVGLAGTAAAGNADVVNVTLSGATVGSTAATTTGLTLAAANNATNETLETLNITSGGTSANDFNLDASDVDVVLSTVNLLGSQDVSVRVASAEVTGITIVGSENTGTSEVVIDRDGLTVATNVLNFSGIDTISVVDTTTPAAGGDAGSLSGVKSGQTIKFMDDLGATVLTGSSVAGASDVLTVVLDNETASTDTDMTSLDIQNVETVNIQSLGNAADTSTTVQNTIDDFTGDATTITITGDTSFDLDLNVDAPASGTRAVTVDASGNTAFVDIAAAAQATVSYSITGTAGADTLAVNATGGTLIGGAGNDNLTTLGGDDTVDGGAGNDTIILTTGTDSVTTGAGTDTIDMNTAGTTAVVQVSTIAAAALDTTHDIDESISVNIEGLVYTEAFDTSHDATIANFISSHGADILANSGVTVSTVDAGGSTSDGTLTFTGAASGAAFTVTASGVDGGAHIDLAVTATAAATTGVTQIANITDFSSTDVLDLAGILTEAGISYYEGAAAGSAAANNVFVLTDAAGFADAEAAEDGIVAGTISTDTADGLYIFLNSTLGHAQVVVDADVSADSANLGASTGAHVLANLTSITTSTQLADLFSDTSVVIA